MVVSVNSLNKNPSQCTNTESLTKKNKDLSTKDEVLREYRGLMKETSNSWISGIHSLVWGEKWTLLTEQHGTCYPCVQSKGGRSQEKGQMANTDTPTGGERRGSHKGKCSCSKAGIQCDESSKTPQLQLWRHRQFLKEVMEQTVILNQPCPR